MALYIPLSRRRRNAALVAVATLLAGLVVGFLVGRTSSTTASEAAATVRDQGAELATRLQALTIEYDQAIGAADSTAGDTVQGGVLDALDLVDRDIDGLIDDAPWIGAAQTTELHDAVDRLREAANGSVTSEEFADVASASAATVRTVFGADS